LLPDNGICKAEGSPAAAPAPTDGNSSPAPVRRSESAFVKTHLSHVDLTRVTLVLDQPAAAVRRSVAECRRTAFLERRPGHLEGEIATVVDAEALQLVPERHHLKFEGASAAKPAGGDRNEG